MPGIAARVNGRLPSPHLAAYFTYPKYGPVVLLLSAFINTVSTLMAACCVLAAGVVHAQGRPDSLAQADEVLVPEVPVGFESADVAATLTDTLLHFDHDLTTALAQHAGSFSYDFGAFGWPAGWSYLGASPSHAALYWHGIPFSDPQTGRPRYDLLPTALLRAPGVAVGARSMPVAVLTRLRSFDATRPLTELHYQAGDNGLQRVTALHAQEAAPRFLGRPRMVQWLFAYAGAAATGEYPGSKLERMRQLLLRSRYRQGMWSLEVMYLHNQRRLGAHGGVVPFADYETVYNRLIAATRGERSVRRDLRHDVSATLRLRTLEAPLTLQAWQTYTRMRYTDPAMIPQRPPPAVGACGRASLPGWASIGCGCWRKDMFRVLARMCMRRCATHCACAPLRLSERPASPWQRAPRLPVPQPRCLMVDTSTPQRIPWASHQVVSPRMALGTMWPRFRKHLRDAWSRSVWVAESSGVPWRWMPLRFPGRSGTCRTSTASAVTAWQLACSRAPCVCPG